MINGLRKEKKKPDSFSISVVRRRIRRDLCFSFLFFPARMTRLRGGGKFPRRSKRQPVDESFPISGVGVLESRNDRIPGKSKDCWRQLSLLTAIIMTASHKSRWRSPAALAEHLSVSTDRAELIIQNTAEFSRCLPDALIIFCFHFHPQLFLFFLFLFFFFPSARSLLFLISTNSQAE